jgi:hypothetical protein
MHILLGAASNLFLCRPMLLIKASCYHLIKSVQVFLDNLGYALFWVASPLLDVSKIINGGTINSYVI